MIRFCLCFEGLLPETNDEFNRQGNEMNEGKNLSSLVLVANNYRKESEEVPKSILLLSVRLITYIPK